MAKQNSHGKVLQTCVILKDAYRTLGDFQCVASKLSPSGGEETQFSKWNNSSLSETLLKLELLGAPGLLNLWLTKIWGITKQELRVHFRNG